MIINIDWLSFSVPVDVADGDREQLAFYNAAQGIRDLCDDLPTLLELDTGWKPGKGRAPYRTSWQREAPGLTIFTHPSLNHALIEISGVGCDHITKNGYMGEVLAAIKDRVTRVDVACDMVTDTTPTEFVAKRDGKRFKAHAEMYSESGETCYVGSRTSARYARVYRYHAPHERSHLLRCEYVVKQEDAKILASTILTDGLSPVAAALGLGFGWQHTDWSVTESAAELSVYRVERREGKTLYWLADTVAPLIARLHNAGVLDVEQWLDDYVWPKIKD